jgi:phage terminase large subunit
MCRGHSIGIIETYAKNSNKYRVRVLGEFPTADDETVISLELVEAAKNRDVAISHVYPVWGVDPARFGDDRSVLAKRQGNTLLGAPRVWRNLDGPQLAGPIVTENQNTTDDEKPKTICVDVINIGASVVDSLKRNPILERDDVQIVAVNVAESPASDEMCFKLRDELWWKCRQWFEARGSTLRFDSLDPEGQKVVLELISELTTPTYDFTGGGKRVVMRKNDMKKLIGKSPILPTRSY